VLAGIGIVGELALGDRTKLAGSTAVARRGLETSGGTGHQTGDGNGCEHGFGCLEEAWIFHNDFNLSCLLAFFCLTLHPVVNRVKRCCYCLTRKLGVYSNFPCRLGLAPEISTHLTRIRMRLPILRRYRGMLVGDRLFIGIVRPDGGLYACSGIVTL